MIVTDRLSLIPATLDIARAELSDRQAFRDLLGAAVPENWPPESAADALPLFVEWMEAVREPVGWFAWYALTGKYSGEGRILVASGGFKGLPQGGAVEIGYSVLPQFQGCGYATEMVSALTLWALTQAGVDRVMAETEGENPASERVLAKVGFVQIGPSQSGGSWFELRRFTR